MSGADTVRRGLRETDFNSPLAQPSFTNTASSQPSNNARNSDIQETRSMSSGTANHANTAATTVCTISNEQ
jgi:hypothetical protein